MNDEELALIPLERLVEEIFKRTSDCVIAYTHLEDDGTPELLFSNEGCHLKKIGLADCLKESIMADMMCDSCDEEDDN